MDSQSFMISECPDCGHQWIKTHLGQTHRCDEQEAPKATQSPREEKT